MRPTVLVLVLLLTGGCINRRLVKTYPVPDDAAKLVKRLDDLLEQAGTRPIREHANRLRDAKIERRILTKQTRYTDAQVPDHFRSFRRNLDYVESHLGWPLPPRVSIPRAAVAPKIDGILDDAVWAEARTFTASYPFNTRDTGGQPTTWKLAWDQDNLYVAYDCTDTDIQAKAIPRDGPAYEDDAVEIFILPVYRFRTYWEIIVTPSGSIYDSIQCKRLDSWGSNHDPAQDVKGMKVGMTLDGTLNDSSDQDHGYKVELAIPFDQLPGYTYNRPEPGQRLYFMLARLDRQKADGPLKPFAFQPLLSWGHNIWNHAEMELNP